MSRRGTAGRRARVRPTRPAVRVGPVILLSLVLLMVGWSLLWLFARHEAKVAFAGWRASERGQGRIWTCPDERVGGYPLGIRLSCDRPAFKGAVADGVFEGTMGGLSAEARLYFPTNVGVTLTPPLQAHEIGTGHDIALTWSAATVNLRGSLPASLDRGALTADTIEFDDGRGAAGSKSRIDHVEIGFRPIVHPATTRSDLEASVVITGAHLPEVDAAVGSNDPLSLSIKGFATQVAFDGDLTLPAVLDPWYRAGGRLHLQKFEVTKGSFKAGGDGRFGLDEDHRVEGRVDASVSGVEPVAARFGIPLGAVKIGGVLSSILGGKTAEGDAQPADMTLPIIAKDGRLFVGPFKTGIAMTPVY